MMTRQRSVSLKDGFLASSLLSVVAAVLFHVIGNNEQPATSLPVLGHVPLFPVVMISVAIGSISMTLITRRCRPFASTTRRIEPHHVLVMGVVLAIPPILVDLLVVPFSRDLNLTPASKALAFYPAIGMVAEVWFHLVPMAVLCMILPDLSWVGGRASAMLIIPSVLMEPLFQAVMLEFPRNLLVFGNVLLISVVQMWLFCQAGFGYMFALRLSFYLI